MCDLLDGEFKTLLSILFFGLELRNTSRKINTLHSVLQSPVYAVEEFFFEYNVFLSNSREGIAFGFHLGCSWIARSERERERERERESVCVCVCVCAIAKGFYEKQCLFQYEGCKLNCHV